MAFPTAASASTDAAAEERRFSYDPTGSSIRKALIRSRAKTPVYHSSVRTNKSKKQQNFHRQEN